MQQGAAAAEAEEQEGDRRRNNDIGNNNNVEDSMAHFPKTKLIIAAVLGAVAILLGCSVLALQIHVANKKKLSASKTIIGDSDGDQNGSGGVSSNSHGSSGEYPKTVDATSYDDIFLYKHSLPDTGASVVTSAKAYWNQFQSAILHEWDVIDFDNHHYNTNYGSGGNLEGIGVGEDLPPIKGVDDIIPMAVDSKIPSSITNSKKSKKKNRKNDNEKPNPKAKELSSYTPSADSAPYKSSISLSRSSSYSEFSVFQLLEENHQNISISSSLFALKEAAKSGHPQAQHYLANSLMSGIWPVKQQPSSLSSHDLQLQVSDEMFPSPITKQQQSAYIYWQMAAISGNLESAMALAYRYEEALQKSSSSGSKTDTKTPDSGSSKKMTCSDLLPYYQTVAHGIMDELEASKHSRTKVIPTQDKHLLHQVHMHGGTSSQLDWNNKPDESAEALQFYHFKATRSKDPDARASYTLATMYHHGYRGVTQNLTKALYYYEIAALNGLTEAAGQVGNFYFYAMGLDDDQRDILKAHYFYKMGVPGGFEGCKQKLLSKKYSSTGLNDDEDDEEDDDKDEEIMCDASCLNGMGLISLFGIPNVKPINYKEAEKFFLLAKDMGLADADYNLAMMKLGWKTHYRNVEDVIVDHGDDNNDDRAFDNKSVDELEMTPIEQPELPFLKKKSNQMESGPTSMEYQHAVQYLTSAFQRGHLQARHRIAMLHEVGISFPTASSGGKGKYEIIEKSCEKALKHYKHIVDKASPQLSKRLRKAYKQYMNGNVSGALRNYLMAAEIGSEVGQVNAAFLLERGECLGLSPIDCAKAAVRLWKAAAKNGNAEACLRVGDFYYYGRLRSTTTAIGTASSSNDQQKKSIPTGEDQYIVNQEDHQGQKQQHQYYHQTPIGPFGFFQYIIFPERYLPQLLNQVWNRINSVLSTSNDDASIFETIHEVFDAGINNYNGNIDNSIDDLVQQDLSMAAHYYHIAADNHHSPRANFNLGFLHEWGLGLKQDFPLAKRHYDLAASAGEADLAVQLALWCLYLHEYIVKLDMSWKENQNQQQGLWWTRRFLFGGQSSSISKISTAVPTGSSGGHRIPKPATNDMVGRPFSSSGEPSTTNNQVPSPTYSSTNGDNDDERTKFGILWNHFWSWESVLIIILTIIVYILLQHHRRKTRTQQQQQTPRPPTTNETN